PDSTMQGSWYCSTRSTISPSGASGRLRSTMAAKNRLAEVSSNTWASPREAQNRGCSRGSWRNMCSRTFSTSGLSSTTRILRTTTSTAAGGMPAYFYPVALEQPYLERTALDLAFTEALERQLGNIALDGDEGLVVEQGDLADLAAWQAGVAGQRAEDVAGA